MSEKERKKKRMATKQGKGRRFQTGNYLDGFKDLPSPSDFVVFKLPDQSGHAEIALSVNNRGELEARTTDGVIVIRPSYSNVVEIRSEPTFIEPPKKKKSLEIIPTQGIANP